MKIAIVAPSPVPFTRGGAERALWGIQAALNDLTHHEAEMIKIPVDESTLPAVLNSYETFASLDLSHFDRIVCTKYPSWMVGHPHKTILMMHPLRGVYDTYRYHHQPLEVENPSDHTHAMIHLMANANRRQDLDEFFERWHNAVADLGADHPDFAFPGPFSRLAIRWLDQVAMAPGEVKQYLSQSQTVADRDGYFPAGVTPRVVNLPGHLPPAARNDEHGSYFFTASRLDGPKRLDLLVDAMAHVPGDIELRIAGTGSLRDELEAQAAPDPRISFLGFTRNDQLPELYANALAVPFIPADEDLGLVTLEAFSQETAVVTCTDSGGPTEFVIDGETGLVAKPTAESVGAALARLATDHTLAARLAAAGKARGEQITWQEVVDAILDAAETAPTTIDPAAEVGRRSPRRLVVLTTFPINEPAHGGQLRARYLYGALARWRPVEVVALVGFGNQPERQTLTPGLTQVVVPRSYEHDAAGTQLSVEARTPITDLVAGSHIAHTPAYLRALADACDGASAVLVAEPYLLPALERLGIDLPLIYDAYNVEGELKAAAYPDTEIGRDLLAQVRKLEARAVTSATLVTTCSTADADTLAEQTGTDRNRFAVVPNGTLVPESVPSATKRRADSQRWRTRYWAAGSLGAVPQHLAVFFGSWHPPNIDAAHLLCEVAPLLGDTLIVAGGQHGDAMTKTAVPANLVFAGRLSNRDKDRLLGAADVALNPMRIGSGTNLKLLEYLSVGLPVVSTPFGARGIEVIDDTHLRFAEPSEFASVVAQVLADTDSAQERATAGRRLVQERYSWDQIGTNMASLVTDIVSAPNRQ